MNPPHEKGATLGRRQDDPSKKVDRAKRRQTALAARRTGATWDQVAEEAGYYDRSHARRDILDLLAETEAGLADDLNEFKKAETLELMRLRSLAWDAAADAGVHVHVTEDGEVVTTEIPPDPELALKAIDRLVKVSDRLAKLHGLDSPTKVESEAVVRYVIDGVDMGALS